MNNDGNQNHNEERNVNATETENTSVPGEVSVDVATSIGSQSGHAGDAFAPRDNCSTSKGSRCS